MRIEIKTKEPIRDLDLRALLILDYALNQVGTPQMLEANLNYIADREGYKLVRKTPALNK